jgi:N-acetylmuramoyl-L-alanine amidase
MKLYIKNIVLTLIIVFQCCHVAYSQPTEKFKVVLDAGHGGKDPGNSYHGFSEKQIALKTTLILYTRKSDVFIELVNRPKVANKANANLFVSIHCNSVKNFGPVGTETFVMGLSRSNMNLEVAKNENAVILLEDNYKETYKGFDPNNPESTLGLKMIQEENLNNSISLATKIQENFTNNLERKSRGVKQQPLWVLDAAYMPSVLIELGFLSNQEEGAFLNSEEGQDKMANEIAQAIILYRNEYFGLNIINPEPEKKNSNAIVYEVKKEETSSYEPATFYKIQLSTSTKKIALAPKNFRGLRTLSVINSGKNYKYMYGNTTNMDEARELLKQAKNKGFDTAFIVSVKDGKIVNN